MAKDASSLMVQEERVNRVESGLRSKEWNTDNTTCYRKYCVLFILKTNNPNLSTRVMFIKLVLGLKI